MRFHGTNAFHSFFEKFREVLRTNVTCVDSGASGVIAEGVEQVLQFNFVDDTVDVEEAFADVHSSHSSSLLESAYKTTQTAHSENFNMTLSLTFNC